MPQNQMELRPQILQVGNMLQIVPTEMVPTELIPVPPVQPEVNMLLQTMITAFNLISRLDQNREAGRLIVVGNVNCFSLSRETVRRSFDATQSGREASGKGKPTTGARET